MKLAKKNSRIIKVVKIEDGRQLWSKHSSWYRVNLYPLFDIALIAPKQKGFMSNEY